ncbi:class I SAM-dependent methyltransferase [Paenibacillus sanfengchensis]|uniref:class I SAM-dependent methyltransferase n=1 Tax=Paenibacillus sanfengchensis TaxID=3119819 RepID=UPI002FDFA3DE
MSRVDWEEESKRFNATAAYYDLYRPSYPKELIHCIEKNSNIGLDSKILEIGAGSGKASELFLNRGYGLVCIEPSPQLAEMGMNKHKDKKVEFVVTRFENWIEPNHYYDMVFSAQAFHWVPKPIGYTKCANSLKTNGYLALFWNMYLSEIEPQYKELISLCINYDVFPFHSLEEIENRINNITIEISNCEHFETPSVHRFPWNQQYNIDGFIGFLKTGSGFLALPESDQTQLIHEATTIMLKHGGRVTLKFISTLFLAKKR